MFIHCDPSELRDNSLFPSSIDVRPCPGLEALTGCDFVISRIPISPVNALQLHISSKALFCQRKSGYDAIGDFKQIWLEIERIQNCKIPMAQTFVLFIGQYKPDKNGNLALKTRKETPYLTLLKIEAELGYSGVQIRRLNDESELSLWIQAQYEELKDIEERGNKKEIFTKGSGWTKDDDPFQDVIEIDDWRNLFLNGVKGIGLRTLEYIQEYAQDDLSGAFRALQFIVNNDPEGKPLHRIKNIGNETRSLVRRILGIEDKYNIYIREANSQTEFNEGWNSALDGFKSLIEEKDENGKPKRTPSEAWQQLRNQEIPF